MKRSLQFVLLGLSLLSLFACGGTSTSSSGTPTQNTKAQVFVTGEDAPMPSVLSFTVTINSITLNNSSGSVQALTQPTTVDFVRLVGLRSLLGFNTIAPGTYTSATFTLSNPGISYFNGNSTPPPVSQIPSPTLTSPSVTVSFPQGSPLVVGGGGLAGLHMDFDLRKSLEVDGTGQLTGVVDPHIYITAVKATDSDGQVTELYGGLSSVNASGNSFVLQGPYGFKFTVDVNSQTQFNTGWSLNNLAAPAFVAVEGAVQADGSVLASGVEVISTTQAFISGRILTVSPGPIVTMFVSEELPALGSIPVDSVQTINLTQVPGSEYKVCFFDNWITQALFNSTSMVAGQRIFVGGSYSSSSGTFTPQMVSLRRQGVVGDLVTSSVNIVSGNQGSFQLQNSLLLGYVLGTPLTVETGSVTDFVNMNGLSGLQSGGQTNLGVRGLVFRDPNTGTPVLWAGGVRVLP